jgi:hypothetical protein
MQGPPNPTEDDEASIPIEIVSMSTDSNMNRTVAVRRKAAQRTLPWDLAAGELDLVPSPAKKKQRLEEPLPTSTDQAATETDSPDVSVGLPPDDANAHPVMDTQPHAVATRATGRWTTDEDAKLTSAVASTFKKKWGNEYKIDWDAVAALVPGRTISQCFRRWKSTLDPSIDRANGRTGNWLEDEDIKLKDAVQMHGGKDWVAISALVPGRTKIQCKNRWHNTMYPSIDRANGRTGGWSTVENSKLKDAVQAHGGKNWDAIAELVPGRTKAQCYSRWKDVLASRIDQTNKRSGKWAEDEDSKLKDAVLTHDGKNWPAIAALVPGRTRVRPVEWTYRYG